jgi:hypothetical protein
MDRPILVPELVRQFGNMFVQKPIASDSSNTFKAGSLVTLTAGVLVLVATDGVLVYGQTPDISHAATESVPQALFGENHWVFSPLDAEFEINVGHLSSNALVVGAANSAKTPGDVVLGGQYAIATATSGAYAGFQVLDTTDTTNKLFVVTGFVDGVASTDANGRVRVKILPSCIQP